MVYTVVLTFLVLSGVVYTAVITFLVISDAVYTVALTFLVLSGVVYIVHKALGHGHDYTVAVLQLVDDGAAVLELGHSPAAGRIMAVTGWRLLEQLTDIHYLFQRW